MPHIDTLLAQAGRGTDPRTGAISTPIYQTSTYAHPGLGQSTGFDYSRSINPTRKALEDVVAELDGAAGAFAFASGLAALSTLFCLLRQGDRLIVAEGCYGGTYRLLDQVFARFGLAADYVSVGDPGAFRAALGPQTRMILVESDRTAAPDRLAESFGGVESLITVPAVQTHANLSPEDRARLGVTDTLLRLSVGIEDPRDLIEDLESALG